MLQSSHLLPHHAVIVVPPVTGRFGAVGQRGSHAVRVDEAHGGVSCFGHGEGGGGRGGVMVVLMTTMVTGEVFRDQVGHTGCQFCCVAASEGAVAAEGMRLGLGQGGETGQMGSAQADGGRDVARTQRSRIKAVHARIADVVGSLQQHEGHQGDAAQTLQLGNKPAQWQ